MLWLSLNEHATTWVGSVRDRTVIAPGTGPGIMGGRKLAAIVVADIVGYSRQIGLDEDGTLARVNALLSELAGPVIAAQGGRIFKTTGDGFLAEFPSAVGAVQAAVVIQEGMPERAPLQLRIGVHLGDVLPQGDDLLGDGVNIAARLEREAAPEGIAVSGAVADAVRGKLALALEDRGERTLKNITHPVRVFHHAKVGASAPLARLAVPELPSIVVLPFQNMSGDPEQDYFADGMVEDITTALSRMRWFFVIARNSAFTYKGRAVDVRQVGRELGVRYVLEGSVRRAGNRVRLTGQLIEAETGHHVWADRFDGALDDVFELQDRVTEAVAAAIEPSLRAAEIKRRTTLPPVSLSATDLYWRALPETWKLTREGSDAALAHLRNALELDPDFTLARATAAFAHVIRNAQSWSSDDDIAEAVRFSRQALSETRDDPYVLARCGQALVNFAGDFATSRPAVERALVLCPTSAQVTTGAAFFYLAACEPAVAIRLLEQSIRFSPLDPQVGWMMGGLALAHLFAGMPEQALSWADKSVSKAPLWVTGRRAQVIALQQLGRIQEARDAASELLRITPDGGVRRYLARHLRQDMVEPLRDALRAAGVPD